MSLFNSGTGFGGHQGIVSFVEGEIALNLLLWGHNKFQEASGSDANSSNYVGTQSGGD